MPGMARDRISGLAAFSNDELDLLHHATLEALGTTG